MPRPLLAWLAALFASLLLSANAVGQEAETAASEAGSASEILIDPRLVGQTREWQVCNETSFALRTASAFLRGAAMSARGWNEILPGACLSITTPVAGPRFLYAESLDAHRGGVREWKGTTPLCVDPKDDFESPATEDCRMANKIERDFFAVRPGEPVTSLVEPADYGQSRAEIAAQQRLLRDVGYDITRIDGYAGRKTSRLLRQFRQDMGLAASVSGEPLLRALIDAARDAGSETGLDVCNASGAPVWTAVAYREEGRWRSRGWWDIAPGDCARPIDFALPGSDAHLYALQEADGEDDKRLRTVGTTPAQFCIAESVFDALGNTQCLEQGYVLASFRPVDTDEPGVRVRLTDADFAARLPGGLRR